MEEEPEEMSIGIVRSVSSVFSGFQGNRNYGYCRRSWWGQGQTLSDEMLEGKFCWVPIQRVWYKETEGDVSQRAVDRLVREKTMYAAMRQAKAQPGSAEA